MNRIQYKTIAEAMAITRCIARGELNKVADLIAKNRTAQIKRLKVEAQEFDATIQALRLELMNIETLCTQLPPGKYLNILKISKKGQMATGLNKRFKNQAMMLKSTPNEIKTHEVNEEELQLVTQSCDIMMRLMCGQIDAIWELIPEKARNDKMKSILAAMKAQYQIKKETHPYVTDTIVGVHHKIWWLHDIMIVAEQKLNPNENIIEKRGSLPLPKIEEK
jgi:hypothetical protein